jgi:hypothetical protein
LTAIVSPKVSRCNFGVLPPHGFAWRFAMWWVGVLDGAGEKFLQSQRDAFGILDGPKPTLKAGKPFRFGSR